MIERGKDREKGRGRDRERGRGRDGDRGRDRDRGEGEEFIQPKDGLSVQLGLVVSSYLAS